MKKTRGKRIWIIVGALVLIVIAVVVFVIKPGSSTAQTISFANSQFGVVRRENISAIVQSSGSLEPNNSLPLNFDTAGTVTQINVKVGDHVKQGDVLAQVDTTTLQLQVAQDQQALLIQQATYSQTVQPDPNAVASAQAALANAQAAYAAAQKLYQSSDLQVTVGCSNLTQAQASLDRAQTAYDRLANDVQQKKYLAMGDPRYQPIVQTLSDAKTAYNNALISCNLTKTGINNSSVQSALAQVQQAQSTLDNLTAPDSLTLETAKAKLAQAQLNLDQSRANLAGAQLLAPFDGVITKINIALGGQGGSNALVMADNSDYLTDVLVDESEIAKIKVGQVAQISFDALPNKVLSGAVSHIAPAGTVVQGVVNYDVQINFDPITATLPLRWNMTTNVNILYETHAGVLAVPVAAVHSTPGGGQYIEVIDLPAGAAGNFNAGGTPRASGTPRAGGGNFGGGNFAGGANTGGNAQVPQFTTHRVDVITGISDGVSVE
ncbi:MAG TPA: HlyD family efflux transporter periplasmic adaptor subunit, partial [Anaerolineae bacterium]|nr:HlyD family efflux transporter periplasmic adaptor subunit [Anaerolineae bacterium]